MILEIISPEKIIFSGEVESVAVPGVNGEFEMLNNHASIVSNLKKGAIKVYSCPVPPVSVTLLQMSHVTKHRPLGTPGVS